MEKPVSGSQRVMRQLGHHLKQVRQAPSKLLPSRLPPASNICTACSAQEKLFHPYTVWCRDYTVAWESGREMMHLVMQYCPDGTLRDLVEVCHWRRRPGIGRAWGFERG